MLRRAGLLLFAAWLVACPCSWAAETQNVTITVTVEYLSILASQNTFDLGMVALDSKTLTAAAKKVVVTNDGNITEDFGLKLVSALPAGWSSGAAGKDDVGPNKYTLCARFVASGAAAPIEADYVDGDLVTSTNKWFTTSVAPTVAKDLYFRFHAPTAVTDGLERTLLIEARCQKTP